jgi:hypothetical protein
VHRPVVALLLKHVVPVPGPVAPPQGPPTVVKQLHPAGHGAATEQKFAQTALMHSLPGWQQQMPLQHTRDSGQHPPAVVQVVAALMGMQAAGPSGGPAAQHTGAPGAGGFRHEALVLLNAWQPPLQQTVEALVQQTGF